MFIVTSPEDEVESLLNLAGDFVFYKVSNPTILPVFHQFRNPFGSSVKRSLCKVGIEHYSSGFFSHATRRICSFCFQLEIFAMMGLGVTFDPSWRLAREEGGRGFPTLWARSMLISSLMSNFSRMMFFTIFSIIRSISFCNG